MRLGQARARGGDYAGQKAAYDQALELDPNNALALGVSAMVAWRNIQPERTVELYRRAEAADPMSSVMPANLSGHLTNLGRFEEAEAAIERARAIVGEPGALAPHEATLALVQGDYERTLELAVSVENTPERLQLIAMAHHGLGDLDAAQAQLNRWLASEPAPSGFDQAGVLAFMGRVDEAFALLEQDEHIELRGGFLVLDALFKNLHGDPRWVDVVARLEAAAAARTD